MESLTIEENVLPYTFGTTTYLETQHNYNKNFLLNSKNAKYLSEKEVMASPTSMISASLDNALPSVAQLANEALVDICTFIGPILSSKYIMKQVYKMFLRESPTLNFLMQSVLAIGKYKNHLYLIEYNNNNNIYIFKRKSIWRNIYTATIWPSYEYITTI